MAYKLLPIGVLRVDDGAFIPPDTGNRDWREYQNWASSGNTPLPQDPAPLPTQDELDTLAAKGYAKLNALKTMTPTQVQAWIDANINTLADAKDALKTLAVAANILARRI